MKILHLPTSVGGNSYGLSRAERSIGLESEVLTIGENYLDYPSDIKIILPKTRLDFYKKIFDTFRMINGKYDIYHFNGGSSLYSIPRHNLYFLDLNFYDKRSKLVVTYNGCDCRQKFKIIEKYDICACANPECYNGVCNSVKVDKIKEKQIKIMTSHCQAIFYLNPDLKQFLPNHALFLPYSIASWNNINKFPRKYNYPLKIVHAPSQRGSKGTKNIIETLKRIEKKFPNKIDFMLVEKMSNIEAIKKYEQADILIDQILLGWYGALSVEGMKAGCAVMVYIREDDLQYIPQVMHDSIKKTFINCNKDNLYEKLLEIIDNPSILSKYSNYSYEYVNTWHSPEYVASLTKEVYEL
jgi:glycosyltransferase involved in cell wall biosynthesis